jgi:hypothetical protein
MITSRARTPVLRPNALLHVLSAALLLTLLGAAAASANTAMESLGISASNDDPAAAAMTKTEKAEKAAELAPTMTTLVADPKFPSSAPSDLRARVEMVLYMGGFHLSSLTIETVFGPDAYEIRSNIRTRGIVDAIVKTNAVIGARGLLRGVHTAPVLYNSDITDRNQRQLVAIAYGTEAGINMPSQILSFPKYNLKRYPVSELEKQHSVDPMSAIMQIALGAELDAQNPCGGIIPVFDGRRRFNLIMEYRGTEEVSTGREKAFEGDALKCWIGFKRVSGYKPRKAKSTDRSDGLSEWPDVYMWLAPISGSQSTGTGTGTGRTIHMPIRMEAHTRLGAVVARATSLVIGSSEPDPTSGEPNAKNGPS